MQLSLPLVLLQAWQHEYVSRRCRKRQQQQAACNHHCRHLLSAGTFGFKQAAAEQAAEKARLASVMRQHEAAVVRNCWRAWQSAVAQQRQQDQQVTAAAEALAWQLWKLKGPRVLEAWRLTAGALQEQRCKVRSGDYTLHTKEADHVLQKCQLKQCAPLGNGYTTEK
jgi:hypothetical protein